jgi:hypothetical protein
MAFYLHGNIIIIIFALIRIMNVIMDGFIRGGGPGGKRGRCECINNNSNKAMIAFT